MIKKIWNLYANVSGVGVIAVLIAYALVLSFGTVGRVIELIPPEGALDKSPRQVTHQVPLGGTLSFTIDFERHESCPGRIVETFSNLDDPSVVVVSRRPTLSSAPKLYRNVRVNTQIPAVLFLGVWKYTQTVDSECPTGSRSDNFIPSLLFEVVKP